MSEKNFFLTEVFRYDDYRLFLTDFIENKKHGNPYGFSQRNFSRMCGFKTPAFMQNVLSGRRNLTMDSIKKVASVIPLIGRPYEYFETLVLFNQAELDEEKTVYLEQLREFKEYLRARLIRQDQRTYLLRWYYPVVREMIKWPDFNPNPRWVAARVIPKITAKQAEEALCVLEALKLARKTSDGCWVQDYPKISTEEQGLGLEVLQYHRQLLALSTNALKLPSADRNVNSITLSLSLAQFEIIRKMVTNFQKEVTGIFSKKITKELLAKYGLDDNLLSKKSLENSLFCLMNTQFFSVAKKE